MRGSSRLLSGLAAAAFALLIVGLGGWWFTLSLGVIVHLALLEFFRLAQFKGIRPASKTTLVVPMDPAITLEQLELQSAELTLRGRSVVSPEAAG